MKKFKVSTFFVYLFLIIGAIIMGFPFIWMILTSLKPSNEVLIMPQKFLPSSFQWVNYKLALKDVPYLTYLRNSVIVAVFVTYGDLMTSAFAAFSFSHKEFKGKKILIFLLLVTTMVPSEILIIPNYITLSHWGWIDSFKAMIIPWITSIFSILFLYQQFLSVPTSYYKVAKVNGCSDLRYLFTILIPSSISSIVAVCVLKFINSWNSYMWPLIVTNSKNLRTLPLGVSAFSSEAFTRYNILMAFSVLSMIPILILYIIFSDYIVTHIGKSGIKG